MGKRGVGPKVDKREWDRARGDEKECKERGRNQRQMRENATEGAYLVGLGLPHIQIERERERERERESCREIDEERRRERREEGTERQGCCYMLMSGERGRDGRMF